MKGDPPEATVRLKQSLPVRTHYRNEPKELNKYTGKPVSMDHSVRGRVFRINTWIEKSPKVER